MSATDLYTTLEVRKPSRNRKNSKMFTEEELLCVGVTVDPMLRNKLRAIVEQRELIMAEQEQLAREQERELLREAENEHKPKKISSPTKILSPKNAPIAQAATSSLDGSGSFELEEIRLRLIKIEKNQSSIANLVQKLSDLQLNAINKIISDQIQRIPKPATPEPCNHTELSELMMKMHKELVERLGAVFEKKPEIVEQPAATPANNEDRNNGRTSLGQLCEQLYLKTVPFDVSVTDDDRAALEVMFEQALKETFGDTDRAVAMFVQWIRSYISACVHKGSKPSCREMLNHDTSGLG